MSPNLPLISALTLLPFVGGIAVLLLGRSAARLTALIFAMAAVGLTILLWCRFQPAGAGMQLQELHVWEPAIGLAYHVGLDGLSLLMLAVSSIVVLMAVAASWSNAKQGPAYFSFLLFLETGLFGTYTALNFLHWFLFWELSLIPAFFLIRIWGGAGRARAATQFFVYTMVGSIALLLSFLAIFLASGSFDFVELTQMAQTGQLAAAIGQNLHWSSVGQWPCHHGLVLRRISGIRGQDAGSSLPRLARFYLCGSCPGDHHGADRRSVENGRVRVSQDSAAHLPGADVARPDRSALVGDRHHRTARVHRLGAD